MNENGKIIKLADSIDYPKFNSAKYKKFLKNNELYIETIDYENSNYFNVNRKSFDLIIKSSNKDKEKLINNVVSRQYFKKENLCDYLFVEKIVLLRQSLEHIYTNMYKWREYSNNIKLQELEKKVTDNDIKKIIKFCKEYGLPFIGNPIIDYIQGSNNISGEYRWCGFKNDYISCIQDSKTYFRVGTFLIAIDMIYKTLLRAIELKPEIFDNLNDFELLEENDDKSKGTEEKTTINIINSVLNSAPIYYRIKVESDKTVKYITEAETLMSAAIYYLSLIILSPSSKFRVIKCENCENWCLSNRKNSRRCSKCTRQTIYRQRHNK